MSASEKDALHMASSLLVTLIRPGSFLFFFPFNLEFPVKIYYDDVKSIMFVVCLGNCGVIFSYESFN